jgi:hypothetical protein
MADSDIPVSPDLVLDMDAHETAATPPGLPPPRKPRGPDLQPRKKRGFDTQAKEDFRAALAQHTADMLARGGTSSEAVHVIKRAYAQSELFGTECARSTAEDIIRRARAVLVERTGKSAQEHLTDAVGFYTQILRDPQGGVWEKLAARKQLDTLLDLHRVGAVTETRAGPVEVREVVIRTRSQASALQRASKINAMGLVEEYLTKLEEAAATRPFGTIDGKPPTSTID